MQHRLTFLVATLLSVVIPAFAQQPARLELKPGDHIALVGNTLADRFQHSGHLESLIVAKHPKHDLVFRNLAAAGDEVALRHRSENFGAPDQWLERVKADVVFAFFGFNESFKGFDGIEKFKADLDKFLKDTKGRDYSGKGPARIVLFSPIANERHKDPNFPDPSANNSNLPNFEYDNQGVSLGLAWSF